MHSVMASERKAFSIDDVIRASSEKLIRRHPHVFGTTKAGTAREVKANWETIKMNEGRSSILDGVPKELPALLRAMRLQEKAAKVGFDWKDKKDVWNKVEEEVGELQRAEESGNHDRIEQELGDVFFALVNYARFLGVNPEFALTKASDKFSKRFRRLENELRKQGKEVGTVRFEEMDTIWDEGKKRETR
jgi:XTP/dITP diphosphohydrolase